MKNNKNLMYVLGALLVIGIVILIIVLTRKKDTGAAGSTGATGTATDNCVPYTQAMMDRDLTQIRSKCYPKLLIPVIGVGSYNNCVTAGKSALPLLNNCGK